MSQDALLIVAAVVFTTWVFVVGATLGSLLNVLVWRMPLGKPLLIARSHCPKCEFAIPARDNIPIFGWLLLKGKCRGCGDSISVRYPLVEFTVAFLFAILFLLEVVGHGVNLPNWFENHSGNWLTELMECELLIVFIRHCVLVYFAFAFFLMDWDRNLVPWRLTITAVISIATCSIILPESQAGMFRQGDFLQTRVLALGDVFIGIFVGYYSGFWYSGLGYGSINVCTFRHFLHTFRCPPIAFFILLGAGLGGLVTLLIALTSIIVLFLMLLSRKVFPATLPLIFILLIQLFGSYWIDQQSTRYLIMPQSWIVILFLMGMVVSLCGMFVGLIDVYRRYIWKPTDSSPND